MERTLVADLGERVGERVRVAGWLHHQRQLARVAFVLVRDATGLAQVVVEDEPTRTAIGALVGETVVDVEATVVASTQAPGGVELHDAVVTVIATPEAPPP